MRNGIRDVFGLLLSVVLICSTVGTALAQDEEIVLHLWMQPWDEWQQDWMNKWVAVYNEQTDGVRVEVSYVPESTWGEKLISAQAAGIAPDIYPVNLSRYGTEVARGTIQPLDPYVDPAIFDDLQDNFRRAVTVNGKYYGYPYQAEATQVLYYRTDMFEQAGLDPESPPKTWDELYEYAQKLTTDYTFGFQLNTLDGDIAWTSYGLQYNTTGGFAINDNWDAAIVNTDDYRDLFAYFKKLHDMGVVPQQALCDPFSTRALCDGAVAMLCAGSWNFALIREEYPDVADFIKIAPVPTRDGDHTRCSSAMGGWGLAIDAKTQHPQEAADFIAWLLAGDPEIMLDFCGRAGFGKCNTRKSVVERINQDPTLQHDEWVRVLNNEIMPYVVPEPVFDWAIALAVGRAITRVVVEGQSIDDSLAQCEREINDYIALNRLAGKNPNYQPTE